MSRARACMVIAALALVIAFLPGCALTPWQRATVTAFVIGSVAIAADKDHQAPDMKIPAPPDCKARPELCR